jgi:hypothetical protein
MPTSSRGMNAKLTTNVPGGLNSGFRTRQSFISQIYKSHGVQNATFYKILGNNQQEKRINNYPAYYQNYINLKRKYGSFTQNNSF